MDFSQLLLEERRRLCDANRSKTPTVARTKLLSKPKEPGVFLHQGQLNFWTKRSPIDIEVFSKDSIPGLYYIPDYITHNEEVAIVNRVYAVPVDNDRWVKLKHRRLQLWGGEVATSEDPKTLPEWLEQISESLVDATFFNKENKPNHVLINEYGKGDYILPHEDGPAYCPLVAILSTGAECRVKFERHRATNGIANNRFEGTEFINFQLERRSLLVFTREAYTSYLHSIDNVLEGTRISLTLRHQELEKGLEKEAHERQLKHV
ncbi:hypothetical protein CCR75_002936 [Bremia lactucae]|uniref:Fe2OG dioxygenase domain-containing protein n=1 Tax=Bremia lactucae TaxID=4779 RepID=A0A976FPY1_BRELC|nr:hypothetical protein CCR75_002936 [Bremia lactucae]